MFASHQKDLLPAQNLGQEDIAAVQLVLELGGRQEHRVDLPSDARLCLMQRPHRFGKAYLAHQQEVYIAACSFFPARHRTEYQCPVEALAEDRQGFLQYIGKSCRFAQDAGQFRIDGALPIGTVTHLVANFLAGEYPGLGEPRQFPVQGTGTGAGQAGDFADVIALFRVQQQAGENFLAVVAKEQ